jgi:hypothetical protein
MVYGQMLLSNLGCDLLGRAALWLACGRWTLGRRPRNVATTRDSWLDVGVASQIVVLVEVLVVESLAMLKLYFNPGSVCFCVQKSVLSESCSSEI